MIKRTRPFPSVFANCKQSKTSAREGLGTKLRSCLVGVYGIVELSGKNLGEGHGDTEGDDSDDKGVLDCVPHVFTARNCELRGTVRGGRVGECVLISGG